jgi:hypothetical protein
VTDSMDMCPTMATQRCLVLSRTMQGTVL